MLTGGWTTLPTFGQSPVEGKAVRAVDTDARESSKEDDDPVDLRERRLELLRELESRIRGRADRKAPEVQALRNQIQDLTALLEGEESQPEKVVERSMELLSRHLDLLEQQLADFDAPSEASRILRSTKAAARAPDDMSFGRGPSSSKPPSPEVAAVVDELEKLEQEERWQLLLRHGRAIRDLNFLRVRALRELPDSGQLSVFSLSQEGLKHLRLELRMLGISLFGFSALRVHQMLAIPAMTRDLVAAGTFGLVVARLALVLLAWNALLRWRDRRTQKTRKLASTPIGRWIRGEGRWLLHVVALLALRWALGPAATWPMVGLVVQAILIYATYRLLLDVSIGMLERLASRSQESFASLFHQRLAGSVRWIVRVAAVFWLLRWIVQARIGVGVLDAAVGVLQTVALLLVIVVVSLPWRRQLEDLYLLHAPVGLVVPFIEENRERRRGLLLLPYLLAWFAIALVSSSARSLSMRFVQSRRAVAYLFRRRMEKRVGKEGYASGRLDELPPELVARLDERIVGTDWDLMGQWPGMQEALATAEAWREGRSQAAVFLAAEVGLGEDAWIERFRRDLGMASDCLKLDRRLLDEAALRRWLAGRLLGDEERGPRLCEDLATGPKRAVVLDQGESLLLTKIGGYGAIDGLANIIEEAGQSVFWLISFGAQAWRHLQASGSSIAAVGWPRMLQPWTEDEIERLLEARLASSSFKLDWSRLASDDEEPLAEEIEEARKGFSRLLWDYADGNPSIALHFFARSLVYEGDGTASVRLFHMPSERRLLELGDDALFLLARLLVHRHLDIHEAAETLGSEERRIRILMSGLRDLGAVIDVGQRYAVPIHWQAAAKRLLQRRNLLVG